MSKKRVKKQQILTKDSSDLNLKKKRDDFCIEEKPSNDKWGVSSFFVLKVKLQNPRRQLLLGGEHSGANKVEQEPCMGGMLEQG